MTKVSLRVYNREIEGMIESGQLDEAVAHCQQILRSFPMHVDTYRLLGKSFLEARRYTDAADIFQRVLMAAPDDFVAHVGMSIIRDDEGKLDDAIWHMERAFEDQPSNSAIQGELRRLYGRRDGIEPPKIRLSRDALANMYAQGELFNQAIAEIRAVLVEDTNRPDLQVMLARAYFHAGQKIEAAEMASNLLKKYTYCFDALRILVDVLPGSTQTENTQVYRQRLYMLDPYCSFVTGSVFNTDNVADGTVNLERLEYKAGSIRPSSQPEWASSLGIKIVDEKPIEPIPDKIQPVPSIVPPPVIVPEISRPAVKPADNDKSVPEWMRSAGWKESTGKTQEGPLEIDTPQQVEPLAQADIPDWLKSMAPHEVTEVNSTPDLAPSIPQSPDQEVAPAWLAGLGTASTVPNSEPSISPASAQDDNIFPDWLKDMGDQSSTAIPEVSTPANLDQSQIEPVSASEQPSSPLPAAQIPVEPLVLSPQEAAGLSTPPTGEPEPPKVEEDALAWLQSLAPEQGVKNEELLVKPENQIEEMPDWLHTVVEQPPTSVVTEQPAFLGETQPLDQFSPLPGVMAPQETVPSEEIPAQLSAEESVQSLRSGNDALFGLEELTPEQGEKEESQINFNNNTEEMPDWLRSIERETPRSAAPESIPALGETQPLDQYAPFTGEVAAPEPVPQEEIHTPPPVEEPVPPLISEEESASWLGGLTPGQPAKKEEIQTRPGDHSESLPDWIQNPTPVSSTLDGAASETAIASSEEDVTITSWLSKQDVEKALGKVRPPAELSQPASSPSSELPDWLKGLDKPIEPEESPKPSPSEGLPEWLNQPRQPTDEGKAAVPAPGITSEQNIPAWMDETIPVPGPLTPTTPGEWVSLDEKPVSAQELDQIVKPAPFAGDAPVQRQILGGTGMLSRVPAEDKDAESLAAAQTALDARQLQEAMQDYAKLIKKNRLLDEVIHDLREAIYRFPVEISVWQTLGDGYMRANRLQDALDAYTKAEELLR